MRSRRLPVGHGKEPGETRCGSCGTTYSGYRWGSCPKCKADDRRQYALICRGCRNRFFATELVDHCPECGSGNTALYAKPETPRVR